MYVVTKQGKKLIVDESNIDLDDGYISFQESVGLYTDDTILKDVWILQLQKKTESFASLNKKNNELQLVKELEYNHEPTKEEILWAMSAYGISRWDIATVVKGYVLDME